MSLIKKAKEFLKHDTHPAIQFIKYGIAGAIATVTSVCMFWLIGWLFFPCLEKTSIIVKMLDLTVPALSDAVRARNFVIANVIAFMFSNMVAYLLNIFFVFKGGRHHWLLEIALFYAVSGASFGIGTLLSAALINQFSLPTDIATVLQIMAALMINYAMRKFVIFKG